MNMGSAAAPQVTKEDQDNINLFGRLNNQCGEIQGKIKAKKKYAEDLEDASNELMLADDEAVKYSYGWVFVHMDNDTAEEKLQEATDEVEQEIAAFEGEMGDVREKMDALKEKEDAKAYMNSLTRDFDWLKKQTDVE
jgi:prefoldin subunit 4